MRPPAAVCISAARMRAISLGLSRVSSPMNRSRTPFLHRSSTSRSIASTNISMSFATSSAGRLQFSLEKANNVRASTPRRAQPSTVARTALTPAR